MPRLVNLALKLSRGKTAFCSKYPELETTFIDGAAPNKFHADLYAIARFILQSLGVEKSFREISVHTNSKMNIFLTAVTLKLAVWQLLFYVVLKNHISS